MTAQDIDMLAEFDVIRTGSNQQWFERHSEIVQDVLLRIAFDTSRVPSIYMCAVSMLFLIPEDDGVYSEFQQWSIHAEMDFKMDCRSVILEYFDIVGRSNFILYHTPYSIVAAVARYVVLNRDGGISPRSPSRYYDDSRQSLLFRHINPCYAVSISNQVWPTPDHEHIYNEDVCVLQQGQKMLYDLFERGLTVLSKVLDREQSCCAVAHAHLYGSLRDCERPTLFHQVVVGMDSNSVHRGRCTI